MLPHGLDLERLWRIFPHTFAARASRGKWLPYKHLVQISDAITAAIANGKGRIIVSIPPRHGKSELISHWTPAWFLDRWPDKRIILGSYEADFAASWGRKVRSFFEQAPDLTATRIRSDSSAADRWETTAGGGMTTAGIGGAFTGKGADLLIIDDPVKNWEQAMSPGYRQKCIDWFNSTFYTRAEPGATIVVLMTRWHTDDLAGRLMKERPGVWHEIKMPATSRGNGDGEALCPERYTVEDLRDIRKNNIVIYGALYDQNPVPLEGGVFKRDWFRLWTPKTLPDTFDEVIGSWDFPFDNASDSASFVSGQIWARRKADRYLLGEWHEQTDYPGMKAAMRAMAKAYPAARTKVIEKKAAGAPLIKDLKHEIAGMVAYNPRGSKIARAIACSGEVHAGNVYVPDPSHVPWAHQWIEEVCTFPKGAFNDRVDAMSQALLKFAGGMQLDGISVQSQTRASPIGGMR